jgi:hypothetical protein
MWLLLSSRLRRWLLLAIALPIGRKAVRRARDASQRLRQGKQRARLLIQGHSALARRDAHSRVDAAGQLDHLPWRRRFSGTK